MMDWIIKELKWKTEGLKTDGIISVFDNGVVKSDHAIPEDLKQQLMEAAAPFENVPEDQKDYHPGSDNKVLDLVHQSLFPLVYGHTYILRDKIIGLDDCLNSVGQGEVLPVPPKPKLPVRHYPLSREPDPISWKYQWLPCDVEFARSEPGSQLNCRITSYINNVHPIEHKALYGVIEKILDRTIPLWNKSLTRSSQLGERIKGDQICYCDGSDEPEPIQGEDEDEDEEVFWDRYQAWSSGRPTVLSEPRAEFKPPNQPPIEERLDLCQKFKDTGLQVIVKLANIELTPEDPEYKGGNWHVEGQLVRLAHERSSLRLILLRTSVSAQRPSTTTTARTSHRAISVSAIALEQVSLTTLAMNKATTISSSICTDSRAEEQISETIPMA